MDIKKFFSNKYNIVLVSILLLGFIIRLKYLTVNTGMWWDEAEYLGMARNWVFDIPLAFNAQRPLLFPILLSGLYLLGANEAVVRFFAVLVPSTLAILLTYLVGKEMYTKKIGLIAAYIMSIFWLLIFNTTRVHTDALAMVFNLLAIYFFWKGYVKEKNKKYLLLMGLFLGLGFLTRLVAVLIALTIIAYLLIADKFKFLKEKYMWLTVGVGFLTVLPYLIWTKIRFGNMFAFTSGYSQVATAEGLAKPFAWHIFGFFKWYTGAILFLVFIVGLVTLFNLIIGFDLVLKNKEKKLRADLFVILWIAIQVGYFVFVQKAAEDRWLMPMAPAMFLLIGKGCMFIYDNIKKYNKVVAVVIVLGLLAFGSYQQLDLNNKLIMAKKDSEAQVGMAGKWIKEHSEKGESVISNNVYMELTYYAERHVHDIGKEWTIKERIKEFKPKYYIVTGFYPSEDWTYSYPAKQNESLMPVQAFFAGDKPIVVIYEFLNYDLRD